MQTKLQLATLLGITAAATLHAAESPQTTTPAVDPCISAGESAKSSKSTKAPVGEVAEMPNPLDFPGLEPVGPIPGGPTGTPLIPPMIPPSINPTQVTNVNS